MANFSLFGLLPPELRLRIWEAAVREPYIIAIDQWAVRVDLGFDDWDFFAMNHIVQNAAAPKLLKTLKGTCIDSRAVAEEWELLVLEPWYHRDADEVQEDEFDTNKYRLRVNFAIDTIFLTSLEEVSDMCLLSFARSINDGMKCIQHLAISSEYFDSHSICLLMEFPDKDDEPDRRPTCRKLLRLLAAFSGLKTLDIIVGAPAYCGSSPHDTIDDVIDFTIDDRIAHHDTIIHDDMAAHVGDESIFSISEEEEMLSGPKYTAQEIAFEDFADDDLAPGNFLDAFRRDIFPAQAGSPISWRRLAIDMTELFNTVKDGRYDSEEWMASEWRVPDVRFRRMALTNGGLLGLPGFDCKSVEELLQ